MITNYFDENFLDKVEEYTGNPLNHKEDLKRIVDIVEENKEGEEFNDLVFTAKYICGLIRVLSNTSSIPEVTSQEQIKSDLNENINKGAGMIKEIISFGTDEQQDYFENTYLSLTAQNFSNLSKLFSDLEAVKKYLNYQKRLSE